MSKVHIPAYPPNKEWNQQPEIHTKPKPKKTPSFTQGQIIHYKPLVICKGFVKEETHSYAGSVLIHSLQGSGLGRKEIIQKYFYKPSIKTSEDSPPPPRLFIPYISPPPSYQIPWIKLLGSFKPNVGSHWKPNTSSTCHSCPSTFTWRNRRHHCRICGQVFCAECTLNICRVNEIGELDPDAPWGRVCSSCYEKTLQ